MTFVKKLHESRIRMTFLIRMPNSKFDKQCYLKVKFFRSHLKVGKSPTDTLEFPQNVQKMCILNIMKW